MILLSLQDASPHSIQRTPSAPALSGVVNYRSVQWRAACRERRTNIHMLRTILLCTLTLRTASLALQGLACRVTLNIGREDGTYATTDLASMGPVVV